MLSFANPWAFSLLALLVPVALLYFLRMRFKRQPVGSAFVWRKVIDKNYGGNRLRFRSILLLALQAAAVCLAAVSAAGPTWDSRRIIKPGVAIVVDASASMSAASPDGTGGSRLERAKRAAAEELKALPRGTPAMLFSGSSSVSLTWSGESGAGGAKAAESIRQEEGAFLEDEAVLAVEAALAERKGAWRAVVFTDGGMDLGGRALSRAFEDAIDFRITGEAVEDCGVSSLEVEASGTGGRASFVLRNGTAAAARREVALRLDGREIARAGFTIPPGGTRAGLSFPEAPAYGGYEAAFAEADGYALNDAAYLALNPERELAVLSVGARNPYIEAALAYRGIRSSSMDSLPETMEPDAWDAVIVNGQAPGKVIACNLAVFGAIPAGAPLHEGGEVSGYLSAARGDHPLSRFLRWDDGAKGSGRSLAVEPGVQAIAAVGSAPVMAAWEESGFRYFASTLDLASSDLGRSQAFPVLMRNLLQWFVPGPEGEAAYTLRVGEGAWRSEGASFESRDPRVEASTRGPRVFIVARERGLYGWTSRNRSGRLAANLPESEMDPAARALEEPREKPSLSAEIASSARPLPRLPIALLALCLAAEWILWSGLPRRAKERMKGGADAPGRRIDAR